MAVTILIAMVAAAVFAVSGYLKSVKTEDFEIRKFVPTIAVGAILGAITYAIGSPVTELGVMEQVAAYIGMIVLLENVLKALLRHF